MKVVLLTLDFPPGVGGVQQYLFEIARRVGRLHDLTVITPVESAHSDETFHRLVLPSFHPWTVARYLLKLRPERVLVGHAHPRLLIPAALICPRRYAAVTYGNDYLAAQSRWHRQLFNALLSHARPLITISQANAQRLQKIGISNPVVVYPGTDPMRFIPAPSLQPLPWTLITVGRLVPRKGIDTVIQTLPALWAEYPWLRYWIIGDGPDRPRLQALSRQLGVAEIVKFMGRVSYEELPDIYRSAHIFVMPAREEGASVEGFGIVYLEASASGLPVVAGRSGGAVEAVRDGTTGILVPPNDPDALLETLRRLLNDPELRVRMGSAGRRWVQEQMNWDRTAREIIQVLECR